MTLAVLALPFAVPPALAGIAATVSSPAPSDRGIQASAVLERSLAQSYTERPAQTIVVNRGDSLESLAKTFHADAPTMRWANTLLDISEPAPGSHLLVPPGRGALVRVHDGDRPSDFAQRLGLDMSVVLDYNALRDNAVLPAGSYLQVPRVLAPGGSLASDSVVPVAAGLPGVPSTQYSRALPGRFEWGQCTYWVWLHRYVPWNGNAGAWFAAARAYGRPEGRIPVQGAIAVEWAGWVGHVAFVERVDPDGTFLISEMNIEGRGVVDERTVSLADLPLIGFIY